MNSYIQQILKLLESGELKPGGIHHVRVLHDDGCGIFDNEACDCEPDVVTEAQR